MLLAFRLRRCETVFDRESAGRERARDCRGITVEDVCDDRLADGLHARTRASDRSDAEIAVTIHIERNVDRAIRGARGAERRDGFGADDDRGVRAAAYAHPRWLAGNCRGRMPRTARD